MNKLTLNKMLRELLPIGAVATKSWLKTHGVPLHRIDNLVKSGQVDLVANGVYKRPDTILSWEGIVSSLQAMNHQIYLGGLSSLEQHGFGHYLSLSETREVNLYSSDRFPSWVKRVLPKMRLVLHSSKRILWVDADKKLLYKKLSSALRPSIQFHASSAELAYLEALAEIPSRLSFEHADNLMAGLTRLSPKRIDAALRACRSVKVKRLFFWFSHRHNHPWQKKVNYENYDLGSGKRVIEKKGALDKEFLITVPRAMIRE